MQTEKEYHHSPILSGPEFHFMNAHMSACLQFSGGFLVKEHLLAFITHNKKLYFTLTSVRHSHRTHRARHRRRRDAVPSPANVSRADREMHWHCKPVHMNLILLLFIYSHVVVRPPLVNGGTVYNLTHRGGGAVPRRALHHMHSVCIAPTLKVV